MGHKKGDWLRTSGKWQQGLKIEMKLSGFKRRMCQDGSHFPQQKGWIGAKWHE